MKKRLEWKPDRESSYPIYRSVAEFGELRFRIYKNYASNKTYCLHITIPSHYGGYLLAQNYTRMYYAKRGAERFLERLAREFEKENIE